LKADVLPGGGAERGAVGEVGEAVIVKEVTSRLLTARAGLVIAGYTSFLHTQ
jgi:hypothetical protein